MNKKGFTLTELIATIVILGILTAVAIPNVLSIIDSNKASSMIEDAKKLIAIAEARVKSDTSIELPNTSNEATVITLSYLEIDDFKESPYKIPYDRKSFVIIKNVGGIYEYSVNLVAARTKDDGITYTADSRAIQLKNLNNLKDNNSDNVVKGSNIVKYDVNNLTISGTTIKMYDK